jgi:hypothetical protein
MPTTPLDRLLFAQGGKCFFCAESLVRAEASVEHLVALGNGGSNHDGNCVACCKAVNALLGSMSLKEKIRVLLNQRGSFRCPNATGRRAASQSAPATASPRAETPYEIVLANLQARGSARPRKPATLRNSIATLFPGAGTAMVESVLAELKAAGKLSETESKVTYAL